MHKATFRIQFDVVLETNNNDIKKRKRISSGSSIGESRSEKYFKRRISQCHYSSSRRIPDAGVQQSTERKIWQYDQRIYIE